MIILLVTMRPKPKVLSCMVTLHVISHRDECGWQIGIDIKQTLRPHPHPHYMIANTLKTWKVDLFESHYRPCPFVGKLFAGPDGRAGQLSVCARFSCVGYCELYGGSVCLSAIEKVLPQRSRTLVVRVLLSRDNHSGWRHNAANSALRNRSE